ncbi:MAG: hypothetical protein K5765_03640 [Clostridia bacterium]|nr:hypothetical protein [Clostridia bacterium]
MPNKKQPAFKSVAKFPVQNVITEDVFSLTDSQARIIYRDFLAKRIGFGAFFSFLGLFISTLITLLTTTFKPNSYIPNLPDIMKGFFICLCFLFGVAALLSLTFAIIGAIKHNEKKFINVLKEYSQNKD